MRQRIEDRYRALSEEKRDGICFLTGLLLGLLLGLIHPILYHFCGLRGELGESFMAFWPVITCLVATALQRERKQTVLACIGAALASSLPYYGSISVVLAVFAALSGALLGVCHFYGRGDSWKSCILRSLCLMPTFYIALWNWDGKPLWYQVLLFLLGIACYLLEGRKNALKVRALVVQGISIALSRTFLFRMLMLFVFYFAQPDYYP